MKYYVSYEIIYKIHCNGNKLQKLLYLICDDFSSDVISR